MPVILRILIIAGIVAALIYGGMLALTAFYEPPEREISVTVPVGRPPK